MKYPVCYSQISTELEYYSEVVKAKREAEVYLSGFKWCTKTIDVTLFTNLGEKLCIFLFEIVNAASEDDSKLWVIVGDFPPMYLDTFGPKSTRQALEDYVYLATEWVSHVRSGKDLANCYPFAAAPTMELADILAAKVKFIKEVVIANIDDISI